MLSRENERKLADRFAQLQANAVGAIMKLQMSMQIAEPSKRQYGLAELKKVEEKLGEFCDDLEKMILERGAVTNDADVADILIKMETAENLIVKGIDDVLKKMGINIKNSKTVSFGGIVTGSGEIERKAVKKKYPKGKDAELSDTDLEKLR